MENNNKKEINIKFNKKVISISFLALALFMLLAVSYAYFTATVTGNDKAKKTTLTTGKMSLVLHGENIIATKENMVPGESVELKFSVENTGNVPTYYNLDMDQVTNTFDPKSDLVYSVKSDKGANKGNTVAPSSNGTLIPNIYIGTGDDKTHTYTLTITFLETHSNQNSNQGKTFTGRIQINGVNGNTLAAAILNDNTIQTTAPDFTQPSPKKDGTDNGKGLFAAPDNDGTSYYFRGDVKNNYVEFAGKTWRIVRINGDGTIRLIMTKDLGAEEPKMVDFTSNNTHDCTYNNPCIYNFVTLSDSFESDFGFTRDSWKFNSWYKDNMKTYNDKVALGLFCNDTSIVSESEYDEPGLFDGYYSPNSRIPAKNPTLICPDPTNYQSTKTHNNGGVYRLKVGFLTADELLMAGFGYNSGNSASQSNYLYDIMNNHDNEGYGDSACTMTPAGSTGNANWVFTAANGYVLMTTTDDSDCDSVLPVINISSEVEFETTGTGEPGTESNPYTIS